MEIVKINKKLKKEQLVNIYLEKFGEPKAIWTELPKEVLEQALLELEEKEAAIQLIKNLVEQRNKYAKNNIKVNQKSFGLQQKATSFEKYWKLEMQARKQIENKFNLLIDKLGELVKLENSEIIQYLKVILKAFQDG